MEISRQLGTSPRSTDPNPSMDGAGAPSVYQKRDKAITEGAAEQEKRPSHVMSAEICDGWQNPKRRTEPAENARSDTRKTKDNQRQQKADRAEDEDVLGKPHSAHSSTYYASAGASEL